MGREREMLFGPDPAADSGPGREIIARLEAVESLLSRIAVASEKTSARMFWLVLPIYISLISAAVYALIRAILAVTSEAIRN